MHIGDVAIALLFVIVEPLIHILYCNANAILLVIPVYETLPFHIVLSLLYILS